MIRTAVVVLAAAVLLAGCGDGRQRTFSGYAEGDLLFIGPTEPGRVRVLNVAEGDATTAGQELARVEDDLQVADLAAAEAQLEEALAKLSDARDPLQRPQEIAVLEASEKRAAAALDLSRLEYDRQKALVAKGASSQAAYDNAQHQFQQNVAALDEARTRIAAARISQRAEIIAAAEHAVGAARANAAAARVRLDRRALKAPADGRVQTLYFRAGEMVPEGRPVLSLLPPGLVKIRFFVPEAALPGVSIGQSVTATCDGCPPIPAKVSFIASAAEYTPPVIYSREERAKLVYLVEARPDDPSAVRPGQPVNVTLGAAP